MTYDALSSCASSVSSYAAQSMLSSESCSSVDSTAVTSPRIASSRIALPPLDAHLKNSSIHLPNQLPVPPKALVEVDVHQLILDEELESAPRGYVIGNLRQLGPSLLTATTSTCLHVPPGPDVGPYMSCTFPSSNAPVPAVYLPSHVLAIQSLDSAQTLLVPVHGLLWAASSPPLAFLSSSPERQPPHPSLPKTPRPRRATSTEPATVSLPVVPLRLPSSYACPLIQHWLYTRSPATLLSSLLPSPPPPAQPASPSPSLSRLLNPTPAVEEASSPPTALSLAESLSALSSITLMRHMVLVHGLWQNAVALELSDDQLWHAMGVAWGVLAGALARRSRLRHAQTTTTQS
ncbi:hypothetical protein BMF94_3897 [Rhodotorula taiwanensis]|uniref:Clp1-like protein n=1 Tax=Rhodotorula taiwanensis TaxID=741276 RepID=A0A2S5B8G8_9BASI|nr:hypothetical protein BMF94_3897 [Rhodotorula taiwanensis]